MWFTGGAGWTVPGKKIKANKLEREKYPEDLLRCPADLTLLHLSVPEKC